MPRIPIADLDDPRIAPYRHLKATNLTRDSGTFVVEGEKLLNCLLTSRFPTASVLATDRHESRVAGRLPAEVPLFVVPDALVDDLVGYNFHRGILACGRRLPPPSLEGIVNAAGPRLTLVACPELANPENLGAIIRIGDVFGIDALLVGGACPDPLSRRVLRVSMGTALRLPVIPCADLAADARRLHADHGVALLATVLDPAAEPLGAAARPDRLALFLGSEGDGLAPEWLALCPRRVTIPMRPGAESLNVAVAAGIFLHQLTSGDAFSPRE